MKKALFAFTLLCCLLGEKAQASKLNEYNAQTFTLQEDDSLRTNCFMPHDDTSPVALCLSGGGSRALVAGMGQMRALMATEKEGTSLFEKTRLISAVSGGGWLSIPFTYLGEEVSDTAFLNRYVPLPRSLSLEGNQGDPTALNQLPRGNIGEAINSAAFSPIAIIIEGLLLYTFKGVPLDRLWQTVIGLHLLTPYGLYDFATDGSIDQLYTYDAQTLETLQEANPAKITTGYLATQPDRFHMRRPCHLCNMALFVDDGSGLQTVAPLQGTSFFTGVLPVLPAVDKNGRTVGGGGVDPFAFSSLPIKPTGASEAIVIKEARTFSLMDWIGVTSAFYAEILAEGLNQLTHTPTLIKSQLSKEEREETFTWVERHIGIPKEQVEEQLYLACNQWKREQKKSNRGEEPTSLVPQYLYWPLQPIPFREEVSCSPLGDGGSSDNTGIASALAYQDIENVIACINSSTPLKEVRGAIYDHNGNPLPSPHQLTLLVDQQLPPLFGYQPYEEGVGYKLYAGDEAPNSEERRFNQLFPSHLFAELLEDFAKQWRAGNPIVYLQELPLLDNEWFRIQSKGRTIKVLWNYLNDSPKWRKRLKEEVDQFITDEIPRFPHYPTATSRLTKEEINLAAHLSGFTLLFDKKALLSLYD